jgi:hypothetical protein
MEQRTVLGGRAWVNGDVRTLTSAPITRVLGSNANQGHNELETSRLDRARFIRARARE